MRRTVAIAGALVACCCAGASAASAQTLSVAPCLFPSVGGESFNAIPVHGDGWATDKNGELFLSLTWLDGFLNADGSRAPDAFPGSRTVSGPSWDRGATPPAAITGLPPSGELPPGTHLFTLEAMSFIIQNGTEIHQAARASATIVQPGVTLEGRPRVATDHLVGKSRLTLWGIDAALSGRRLYGHVLAKEHGRPLRTFRAGVAGPSACSPVRVPKKEMLASPRGRAIQYVRFTDTRRYEPSHDIPVVSIEVRFRPGHRRADVGPTLDAIDAGAGLWSAVRGG